MKHTWWTKLLGLLGLGRNASSIVSSEAEDMTLPVQDRLSLTKNGQLRPVENPVGGDESLYRAIEQSRPPVETSGGLRLSVSHIDWAGTRGVSVNRSKFSKPEDLHYTLADPDLGWAEAKAADIPSAKEIEIPATTGQKSQIEHHFAICGNQKLTIEVSHDPAASSTTSDGRALPENYAHTAIQLQLSAFGPFEKIPPFLLDLIRDEGDWFRFHLAEAFHVRKVPSPKLPVSGEV